MDKVELDNWWWCYRSATATCCSCFLVCSWLQVWVNERILRDYHIYYIAVLIISQSRLSMFICIKGVRRRRMKLVLWYVFLDNPRKHQLVSSLSVSSLWCTTTLPDSKVPSIRLNWWFHFVTTVVRRAVEYVPTSSARRAFRPCSKTNLDLRNANRDLHGRNVITITTRIHEERRRIPPAEMIHTVLRNWFGCCAIRKFNLRGWTTY